MTELPQELLDKMWRVSPALTAVTLSRTDPVKWSPAPHLMLLSNVVRDAVTGVGPRFIIVNMPPRHGKSWFLSKWVPTWYLENWPERRVMLCGYGANFASEWGRAVRNNVAAHQDMLSFQLSEDSKASNKWRTTKDGGMVTAGVGGDITGKGANLLIIDDPVKNIEEANSRLIRDNIWSWWTSTARTRLEPGGVIVLIMTRWHEDDLAGRMVNPEWNDDWNAWKVISLPAVYGAFNSKTKTWDKVPGAAPDPLGRTPGQTLWPERFGVEEMARIRCAVGEQDWYALYQQVPARMAGVGNVYHSYDDQENVMRLDRDPNLPLIWSLDFNIDPMCSIIAQCRETITSTTILTNEKLITFEVLNEMVLPNSKTFEACMEFVNRTREYVRLARGRRVKLEIYGDVSGNQRSTNADETDFQIIKGFFARYPEYAVTYYIGRDNPAVKSRTNAVNAALKSAEGFRRLLIDPRCVGLRKDLQQVKWKRDAGGNTMGVIDKSDASLTHASDALGYVIFRKFNMRDTAGEQSGLAR